MSARIILDAPEVTRPVKVMQIQPYRDGGFAVLVPYHAAQKGFLFKHAVDYDAREMLIPRTEVLEYSASDRVKLSLHKDGFVQFSGENQRKILSGRDPETGAPKGLGIVMPRPLDEPIETGPTFALTIWGLGDFASAKPRDLEGGVVFRDPDFHNKDHYLNPLLPAKSVESPYRDNGYVVEAFVLQRRIMSQLELEPPGESVVRFYHPHYQWEGGELRLKVVDLPGQPVFLGFMVSRLATDWTEHSGFSLHSPTDMQHALAAVYPSPAFDDEPEESLDWTA